MKSIKNILAMVALVTVMGVSSSYAGVYWADRNGDVRTTCTKDDASANGGILVGDFAASLGGILVGDFAATGILVGDLAGDTPICNGNDSANGGIMVGD